MSVTDSTTTGYILFSNRNDVIHFIGDKAQFGSLLKVQSSFPTAYSGLSESIIIDASLFENIPVPKVIAHLSHLYSRTLFVISEEVSEEIKGIIYANSDFIVPYPSNDDLGMEIINEFVNSMHKRVSNSFIKPEDWKLPPEELLNAGFIGLSPAVKKLRNQIITYAKSNEPLLLEGETGTGKSTAAEIVHLLSSRREKNFFPLNLASIPENLIESTLFGVAKGSYTDAVEQDGFCGRADGGTLFLDEFTSLKKKNQTKLNQLLDTGMYYRVGGNLPESADIHFILATNENLEMKILNGDLKNDFYYRISNNVIHFPPLRERKEDIPMLAEAAAAEKGKKISVDAINLLMEYDWPGNVRQLKGQIYNAATKAAGEIIEAKDLF